MFNKATGTLNPALRPDGYDNLSAQIVENVPNPIVERKTSKGIALDLTPAAVKFAESALDSTGLRATSDSLARYSAPKLALKKAMKPNATRQIA